MSEYFPNLYKPFDGDVSVKLDLPNFATKADLKGATEFDTSNLAVKSDLGRLKTEVDKIDVDKLKTVHIDLSKRSNAVKNEVVKKTVYNILLTKVNTIENDCNAKVSGIENKIPSITSLATTAAFMR